MLFVLTQSASYFLGGAGSLKDIGKLVENFGVVGCAAGSLFVFKGKYRAVLINYPSFDDKYSLLTKASKFTITMQFEN